MIYLFSEIFAEFAKAKTDTERITVLHTHHSPGLKEFLNYLFNPNTQFEVTIPKYTPSVDPAGLNLAYLQSEVEKLYVFVKGHPQRKGTMNPRKAQQNLYTLLSCLHKDEAVLLDALIRKTLTIPHLTPTLVKHAYPDMPWSAA